MAFFCPAATPTSIRCDTASNRIQSWARFIRIKDETDLLLIEAAERRRIPLFAICFGMQILNVSRGGTLIQDIGSQLPEAIKHEQGAPRDRPSHRDHAARNRRGLSGLRALSMLSCNSHHHQAIESLGADLVATAWSTDGVIEALEDPRPDRFIVAVQWHPELGWERDAISQRLVCGVCDEAAKHRKQRALLSPSRKLLPAGNRKSQCKAVAWAWRISSACHRRIARHRQGRRRTALLRTARTSSSTTSRRSGSRGNSQAMAQSARRKSCCDSGGCFATS